MQYIPTSVLSVMCPGRQAVSNNVVQGSKGSNVLSSTAQYLEHLPRLNVHSLNFKARMCAKGMIGIGTSTRALQDLKLDARLAHSCDDLSSPPRKWFTQDGEHRLNRNHQPGSHGPHIMFTLTPPPPSPPLPPLSPPPTLPPPLPPPTLLTIWARASVIKGIQVHELELQLS